MTEDEVRRSRSEAEEAGSEVGGVLGSSANVDDVYVMRCEDKPVRDVRADMRVSVDERCLRPSRVGSAVDTVVVVTVGDGGSGRSVGAPECTDERPGERFGGTETSNFTGARAGHPFALSSAFAFRFAIGAGVGGSECEMTNVGEAERGIGNT